MEKIRKYVIPVIICVMGVILIGLIFSYVLLLNYTERIKEENERVQEYIDSLSKETETEIITNAETTMAVSVEESTHEVVQETETTTEEFIYWEEQDDRERVYFPSSKLITGEGFLPVNILAQLTLFLDDKIKALNDRSREMYVDKSERKGELSIIYFHTDVNKYMYTYNWDTGVETLSEDN